MSNQLNNAMTTPVGRLVGGDPYTGQTKDSDGNPLVVKTGANAGQPRVSFYLGIAVPKDGRAWEQTEWGTQIMSIARAEFPAMFDPATGLIYPGRPFAFKVTDGDSQVPNTKGKKPCDNEGYPGHWVLHFSNGFAPKCVDANGVNELLEQQVKCGHYIQIMGYIKGNGSAQQPGIYLNTKFVAHSGYGPEIQKGADSSEVGFGGGVLPPGASATPIGAVNTTQQQAATNTPVNQQAAGTTPIQQQYTQHHQAQQAVVTPATDLVTPGGNNPPPNIPGTNPPPPGGNPPPPVEKWIYNNIAYTRAEILSWEGWTEEHIGTLNKAP